MGWQWTPYLLVLLASAVLSFGLAGYALVQHRRVGSEPVVLAFAATAVGTGLWSVTTALQVASTTRGAKLFWGVVNVTPGLVEVGFLAFALALAGRDRWLTPWVLGVAASEPLVYRLVVRPTYRHHDLFVRSATVVNDGGVRELRTTMGAWAVFDAAWGYALVLVGMAVIVDWARSAPPRRRRQAGAVLVGAAIPLALNLPVALEMAGVIAWPYDADLAPAGFSLAGVALAVAVFRYRFLDPIPMAHDALIDRMNDGVLTLDRADRIVECNRAAREMLPVEDPLGRSVADAFGLDRPDGATTDDRDDDGGDRTRDGGGGGSTTAMDGTELADLLRTATPGDEVGVTVDGEHRYLAIEVLDLTDHESHVGRLVTLRDVTEDRRREALSVLNRVLRHNVRNDLTVVLGHAEYLETRVAEEHADSAEKIQDVADRLTRRSDKARTLQDVLVDGERGRQTYDLGDLARERASDLDVGADLAVDVEADPTVRVDRHLPTAVDELVQNAVEHAGDDPSVTVRVHSTGDRAVLAVADDGPGIHESEYEPLERRRESSLEHGSGLGLWIVDWIVRSSDGELEFAESTAGGTLVRVELPVADDPGDRGTGGGTGDER